MLVIRNEQMRAMAREPLAAFKDQLAAHVVRDFPEQAEMLGTSKILDAIHYGVEKALHFGFETSRELSRYVYLMFIFGRDFEKDDELPWAGEILGSKGTAATRMDQLYEAAGQFEHLGGGLDGGEGAGLTR